MGRSPGISLTGAVGARLEFTAVHDLDGDFVFVETSVDGATWERCDLVYGTSDRNPSVRHVDLSALDGRNFHLRFVLVSNASAEGRGIAIDDLTVSAVATVTNAAGSVTGAAAVLGVTATANVRGAATEFAADIVHRNGNVCDQVLLQGAAAAITADAGQIVRCSFVDANNDIVQVESSGAGTLTILLDGASGPAATWPEAWAAHQRGRRLPARSETHRQNRTLKAPAGSTPSHRFLARRRSAFRSVAPCTRALKPT